MYFVDDLETVRYINEVCISMAIESYHGGVRSGRLENACPPQCMVSPRVHAANNRLPDGDIPCLVRPIL